MVGIQLTPGQQKQMKLINTIWNQQLVYTRYTTPRCWPRGEESPDSPEEATALAVIAMTWMSDLLCREVHLWRRTPARFNPPPISYAPTKKA